MSSSITPLPKRLLHAQCQPSLWLKRESGSAVAGAHTLPKMVSPRQPPCAARRCPDPGLAAPLIYRVLNRVSEASEEDLSPLVDLDRLC